MPLPKPLKRGAAKGARQRVVSETMHDLKHGPHHGQRTHKQEVAIAMKQSGQSRRAAGTHTTKSKPSTTNKKTSKKK